VDQSALVSLMVELFATIKLLSGYPIPAVLPEVHTLSQVEIQRRLCDSRPCRIKAYYHPDSGVVIDETLDVRNDPFDRSILLHELVHHLQKTSGKYEVVRNLCNRRNSEEREAYEIQNTFLAYVHAPRRALAMSWTGKCAENEETVKARALPAANGPAL
jgi:Domain of unknown function (DUF6647)